MYTPFTITGSSLELLKVGDRALVKFCKIQDQSVIEKLKSLGLTTGATITLEQDFPSFIIKVGNILLELKPEVARAIYVRIIKN